MAETEQRFVLHARSRNVASIIGYPVGGGLVLLAIAGIPWASGGTGDDWCLLVTFAGFGLFVLWGAWSTKRRRIEVTELTVTVVQPFSRYEMPWSALVDIELDNAMSNGGGIYSLAFVTPTDRIVAQVPAGGQRVMTELRDRILRARDASIANQAQVGNELPTNDEVPPAAEVAVKGPAAVGRAIGDRRIGRSTVRDVFQWALIVALVFWVGLPVVFIYVLDGIAGDWLTDHVAFWDELIGFYDWLPQPGD